LVIKSNKFPTPRSEFAYTRIGEILVIYGGESDSVLLGDIHYLNLRTQEWKSVESKSTGNPTNRKGSCMAAANDSIFIFGGITNQGYSNELWMFDSGSGTYTLLDSFGDIPIQSARGGCKAYINKDKDVIFETYLGESAGSQPSSSIYSYNISQKVWTEVKAHTNQNFSRSQAAVLYLENSLLVAGGTFWSFRSQNEIYIYDSVTQITQKVGTLPYRIYNAGSVYYKNKLYIHGGGASFNSLPIPESPMNNLIVIDLSDPCTENTVFCEENCSPGSYYTNEGCIECPVGYYNEEFRSIKCKPCPAGYFSNTRNADSSRFCKPCSKNSLNNKEGQAMCFDCPANIDCSTYNTISQLSSYGNKDTITIHPSIFKTKEETVSSYTSSFNLSLAIFSTILLLLLISFHKTREFITNLDYYSFAHNYSGIMVVRQTFLGGLSTAIFLIIGTSIAFTMGISYGMDNITETKALVPSIILEGEYGSVSYI
jgi:hypothetical protein